MTRETLFNLFVQQINLVLPELAAHSITATDSLKALGANSIDRAEIIMLMMAELKLKIPLIQFASAQNIQGLIDVFYEHLQQSQKQTVTA